MQVAPLVRVIGIRPIRLVVVLVRRRDRGEPGTPHRRPYVDPVGAPGPPAGAGPGEVVRAAGTVGQNLLAGAPVHVDPHRRSGTTVDAPSERELAHVHRCPHLLELGPATDGEQRSPPVEPLRLVGLGSPPSHGVTVRRGGGSTPPPPAPPPP